MPYPFNAFTFIPTTNIQLVLWFQIYESAMKNCKKAFYMRKTITSRICRLV